MMRWRGLYRNPISYFGGLIIILSLLLIFSSLLVIFTRSKPSPYLGIFTYLIFPGFLTLGVLIFLYGWGRERRRRRLGGVQEAIPLPILDLNNPQQRKRLALILVGGCFLAVLLSFLAYNAYVFTDTVTFCGKVCHRVMEPEYKAYLNGPHARVPCVECHVGPGVSWYLRSKISGVPQVFATIFHTYPTPLSAPIKNLRPARETCEQCHWPQKFYGAQLVQIPFYRYDEKNTAQQITFLVKTGGGNPNLGENAGIHWHMIIHNKVYFRATDRGLQHIPWIKLELADGSVVVYKDRNIQISEEELKGLPIHLMDCMHCHNRPSHNFLPPDRIVDQNIRGRNISSKLPWIKRLAVAAIVKKYKDTRSAHKEIRKTIEEYYMKNFPNVFKGQGAAVKQAAEAILNIYDHSVFPSMKVNWASYPNDIGHLHWPGCFRCHDGKHVDPSGRILTNDCTICHTLPQRGPLMPLGGAAPVSQENWHPWPLRGKHADLSCHTCHQEGYPSLWGCSECHKIDTSAPMMAAGCNTCHGKEGEISPLVSCRSCHSQLGELHKEAGHSQVPCNTCHQPHTWKTIARNTCLTCHGDKKDHYAPKFCGKCHSFGMA